MTLNQGRNNVIKEIDSINKFIKGAKFLLKAKNIIRRDDIKNGITRNNIPVGLISAVKAIDIPQIEER